MMGEAKTFFHKDINNLRLVQTAVAEYSVQCNQMLE